MKRAIAALACAALLTTFAGCGDGGKSKQLEDTATTCNKQAGEKVMEYNPKDKSLTYLSDFDTESLQGARCLTKQLNISTDDLSKTQESSQSLHKNGFVFKATGNSDKLYLTVTVDK
ncbi:hypothetical protein [Bifidobacterium bombi]|uniref:Lipoprotein n=1 Tax=Bifidobacterium bombi DSM 19703 TaxID=1341695 RepID=A0A080N3R3_9BIFI|nr:hypothetical protein [Bifidobacterium bombi]KFF31686.1 hypothetical protein BBOMB_1073 [Bifidobacterium bombi DSM 19703]